MPTGSSPSRAVTIVTPLGHRASVSRNRRSDTLSSSSCRSSAIVLLRPRSPEQGTEQGLGHAAGAAVAPAPGASTLFPIPRVDTGARAAIGRPMGERLNLEAWWTVDRSPVRSAARGRKELFMAKTFADLGVSGPVRAALDSRGITTPFPVQELVLPVALTGRDVMVSSPTGSGKTLAFGLPLIA